MTVDFAPILDFHSELLFSWWISPQLPIFFTNVPGVIHTVRTDRGHEFQALFHWHVEDKGMRHVYIKPRSPQLNGKVERSHRTDGEEFYQLLSYTDDVDLNGKLRAWERFYNYDRPHSAFKGKTPYEALKNTLTKVT